ncbi:MAG: DoxX family protein [Nanoarchaeota archaeon]
MDFAKTKNYAPMTARIGLSLVFLWFGFNQLMYPLNWIGWVPQGMTGMIDVYTLVFINGLFEIIFGALLLIGLFTRVASGLLALHLLGITFTIGFNEIGIRDLGLTLALVSVFLHGPDAWCLGAKK